MASPTNAEMLEAVETAIQNIMNGGAVKSYSIGDRNISKMSLSELMAWRDKLKSEQCNADGGTNYVRFDDP